MTPRKSGFEIKQKLKTSKQNNNNQKRKKQDWTWLLENTNCERDIFHRFSVSKFLNSHKKKAKQIGEQSNLAFFF